MSDTARPQLRPMPDNASDVADQITDLLAQLDGEHVEIVGRVLARAGVGHITESAVRSKGGDPSVDVSELTEEDQDMLIDAFTDSVLRQAPSVTIGGAS